MNLSGTNTVTTSTAPDGPRRGAPPRLPRLWSVPVALVLALAGVLGIQSAASAITQASAASQLRAAGITWSSSGGCTTRSNPTCTSFEGVRQATVDGAITLKRASGCALNITGGTEVGHASGTYSHYNGYKLDFSRTTCLTSWIHSAYTYIGPRSGDGAPQYRAASGNVYADEGSHWDVTFYTCGC